MDFFVLLIFGTLTFLDAPRVATNQTTFLIGVWEQINIGIFLLWKVVLTVMPLQKEMDNLGPSKKF